MHLFSNSGPKRGNRTRLGLLGLAGPVAMAGVLLATVAMSGPSAAARSVPLSHQPAGRPAGASAPLQEMSTKNGSGKGTTTGSGTTTTTTTTTTSAASPLTYHGGGVFTTPYTVHTIYWVPPGYSVASGYQATVDGFVKNLAAASGSTSNVFGVATQYANSSGTPVVNSASFGGSVTDSTSFPASGCKDAGVKRGPCLSDLQVVNELHAVAGSQSWSLAYPNVYVMLMPKGVGNCASTSAGILEGYCTFGRSACSWHHDWSGLYFMVVPDPATAGGCGTGQSPNGPAEADSAVDLISHELIETLTDPSDAAWYDAGGAEIADKCLNAFGTPLGGTSGHFYNQVINGAHYYLQGEWSNASKGCAFQGA